MTIAPERRSTESGPAPPSRTNWILLALLLVVIAALVIAVVWLALGDDDGDTVSGERISGSGNVVLEKSREQRLPYPYPIKSCTVGQWRIVVERERPKGKRSQRQVLERHRSAFRLDWGQRCGCGCGTSVSSVCLLLPAAAAAGAGVAVYL